MCYKKFDESKEFLEAEQHCIGEGGHLARISSEAENEMVGAIGGSGVFWIGLWSGDEQKCYIDKSRFVWTDEALGTYFDDWPSSQPDCCSPNNVCKGTGKGVGTIISHPDLNNRWDDALITDQYPFICGMPQE